MAKLALLGLTTAPASPLQLFEVTVADPASTLPVSSSKSVVANLSVSPSMTTGTLLGLFTTTRNGTPAAAAGAVSSSAPDLSDEDHARLRDLVTVLTSSGTQRAFKDYLDLPALDAAETVSWAVRLLVRAAQPVRERAADHP